MQLQDISIIAVIGAGTMGSGIAQLAAQAGYQTIVYDIQESGLETGKAAIQKNLDGGIKRGKISEREKTEILTRIQFTTDFKKLKADVIIEAVLERLDIKTELFQKLSEINGERTIYATNTSSIPITQIAAGSPYPSQVVGMHFFNPAHIMKLVEVISGVQTSDDIAKTVFALAEKMGKQAVFAKDAPGFIVNRVARHFYVESLQILEEGVADVETIDSLIQGSGFKMGPFTLMDLIGVETNYSVTSSMFESFKYAPKFRPSRIQEQLKDAGYHGRKSGRGFYDYSNTK